MDSETLNGISLSGIINQFINIPHQVCFNILWADFYPFNSQEQEHHKNSPDQTNLVYQISSPAMSDMMQQQQQQQYNNISYNIMQQPQPGDAAPEQLKPRIRILEQPKTNSLRFRYQCEGRGAGALQGSSRLIVVVFLTLDDCQVRARPRTGRPTPRSRSPGPGGRRWWW